MVAFVAWMIGWPLAWVAGSLMSATRKRITGDKQMSQKDRDTNETISAIIWIVFAIVIFRCR